MDLRLTPEQRRLREEATAFCLELRPLLEADPHWWREGIPSDGDSRDVTRALGEAGWIGLSWPVELGGRGLSRLDATLVEEVFGYHWVPLSHYLLSYKTIGAALERYGSEELQQRLLPPIARGELVFCQGFSEPGAGSDLAALTTRARREGDVFVVDGHKIWTSSAHLADWIYVAARTDTEVPKHRGISVLVAPMDTPGIDVRVFPTLGGGWLAEVFLDGVEVPAAQSRGRRQRWLVDPDVHAGSRAGHGREGRRRPPAARPAGGAARRDRDDGAVARRGGGRAAALVPRCACARPCRRGERAHGHGEARRCASRATGCDPSDGRARGRRAR